MPQLPLWTYQDLLDHCIDFLGANVSLEADRDARRGILSALRVFTNAHRWSMYYRRGRIITQPMFGNSTITNIPPPTGASPTIQYTNATQTVTLTGGIWPSWISQGTIVIGVIEYPIVARTGDTTILLDPVNHPGTDLPAGTLFFCYLDNYPLPSDFVAMDQIINTTYITGLDYVHPSLWLSKHRLIYTPAVPYRYTIMGSDDFFGTLALRLFPGPDIAYQLDFIYQRRPRPLRIDNQSLGSVTITPNIQTLTGAGTVFTSNHVGSVIRFSADGLNFPTGVVGSNPYNYERIIMQVNSPTSLVMDATIPDGWSNVKYVISDPVDVEEGTMMTAFLRCVETELSRARNMKDRGEYQAEYNRALTKAKEADARTFEERAAGYQPQSRLRLAYMPRGPDIG